MKKLLLVLSLVFTAAIGRAQNFSTLVYQYDGTGTLTAYWMLSPGNSGADGVWTFDAGTGQSYFRTLGSGLQFNGTAIEATGSPSRVFNYPTRTLNAVFQASTTRDAAVSYSVDIAATLSLVTGQTGTVVLEYADDSGITTNVKTVQSAINANTGTLTIGLGLTQTVTATLTGTIPASKWVRIRTVNTVGTPTFTYRTAQEVLQ